MLLSGLDGFLTGILVGPEPIPASEWMPVIWGGAKPEFATGQQAQLILGTIIGRSHEIAATMASDPGSCAPIFYAGPDGTLIAADWAAGFLDAVKLRLNAWEPLIKHRTANILLVPLIILGDDEGFFERRLLPYEKEFYATKPDVIKTCSAGIYDFWRDQQPGRPRANPRRPPGRRGRTR